MPELPEVETVCRYIAPALCGRRIEAVRLWRRSLREPLPADFARRLRGRTVAAVYRRAKYIVIDLDEGYWLIHLGMSGALRVEAALRRDKHTHVGAQLDSGAWLTYTDPRRFGRMTAGRGAAAAHPWLADCGPEPLARGFSAAALRRGLAGKTTAIKVALMDGQAVAGIGNIYASEILFECGVAPAAAAGEIDGERLRGLTRAIRAVLRRAIAAGGSSMRDFVGGDGKPGYFQTQWQIYGQRECGRCGGAVSVVKQSGRATYYCPRCQT